MTTPLPTAPDRFKFEWGAKIKATDDFVWGASFWPNGRTAFSFHPNAIDCYNSEGQWVAAFKLKEWK